MTNWNNYIVRKHGKSIRREVFRAYQRSYARAAIIMKIRDILLKKMMNEIPDENYKE